MIQKKIFTGGMNSDSSEELMPEGFDRYRLNCRVLSNQDGNIGNITTVNGNTLVSFALPSGNNTCIGSKEYPLGKKVYYFLYNDTDLHSILEFDSVANTVAKVFQDGVVGNQANILNFDKDHLITGINIVELTATAHLLYWTDRYNEPRKINIEKGKLYMAGQPGGYDTSVPFNPENLFRIKQPMLLSPTAVYATDAATEVNLLKRNLFQFKVQFVYDDYEVSAWSPISKTAYPINSSNNIINVTFDTGIEIVKSIRVAVKFVAETDFKFVVELNKAEQGIASNSTHTYSFYNNGNYVPLEVNESIKLFDNVPKLSQAQELIFTNRLVDGLITEGFDNTQVDLKLNFTLGSRDESLKRGGRYIYGAIYYDHGNRSGVTNINTGSFDTIQNNGDYGTSLFVPFITAPTPDELVIKYANIVAGPFVVGDVVETDDTLNTGVIVSVTPDTLVLNNLTGTWLPITYGPILTSIAFGTTAEMRFIGTVPLGAGAPIVDWTLYNEPPSWATHYQLARTKDSSNSGYLQWIALNPQFLDNTGAVVAYSTFTAVNVKMNILSITGAFKVANPDSILVYDYAKGDRMRIIYTNGFADGYLDAYIDLEVVKFDSSTGDITAALPDNFYTGYPSTFPELTGGTFIEIYHTTLVVPDDDKTVFEIGCGNEVTFDAARGHYIHHGDVNNQLITDFTSATYASPPTFNAVLPVGHGLVGGNQVKIITTAYSVYGTVSSVTATSAVITTTTTLVGVFNGALPGTISKGAKGAFTGGDTFYRTRNMVTAGVATVEDHGLADTWISDGNDYGRPNRIDKNNREITRMSTIFYSEQLVPETFINGLSSVFDTSFETYESKYGGIYKLYAKDQMLIMFQELKVSPIPVLQNIFQGTQGGSVVGTSTQVLSPSVQVEGYTGEFGIGRNPESFAVYGNSIYFIDVYRCTPLRLSRDGLTPLAEEGFMNDYFIKKCSTILSLNPQVKVYGVYDLEFGEYIISFEDINGSSGETVAFDEGNNTWNTYYSYLPENMCSNSGGIISFKNGALWTHNSNAVQNNFYGVQYTSDIWMILNDKPENEKVFTAVEETSQVVWTVPSISNIDGQESNLVASDFTLIEQQQQYAPVWRDVNTPNLTAGTALFEGDPMRSRTFLIKMQYAGTSFAKIYSVNLRYEISNLHNA